MRSERKEISNFKFVIHASRTGGNVKFQIYNLCIPNAYPEDINLKS